MTLPGLAYHVLNRRVLRLPFFAEDKEYLAFERVLGKSRERRDGPHLPACCLMRNQRGLFWV